MLTFFLHVPKTAGQTLQRWLEEVYGADGLLLWNPQPLWRLGAIRRQLAALLEERPGVQAVAGHFPYGVHTVLGDRPYRYVTFLRDPVDRWISERVHHLTKNADYFLLRRPFADLYGDTDLFRLLCATISGREDVDLQSRFIRHGQTPGPAGPRPGAELSDAEALGRFWFVGRQESLAADCQRLAQLLDRGPMPLIESRNVAGHGDIRGALTEDEVAWIAGRNAADIALCSRVPAPAVARRSPPAPSREALVAAFLHAALRRTGECLLHLHADRLEAQKLIDHFAAQAAAQQAVEAAC